MLIRTQRLIIRDLETDDKIPFAKMAEDGSVRMILTGIIWLIR